MHEVGEKRQWENCVQDPAVLNRTVVAGLPC
jgi:hypothetical protein